MSATDNINKHAFKAWSSSSVSDAYEKTRPGYNTDSVEFLLEKVGAFKTHSESEPFTIVELGAGTGKFTRAVLKVFEKRSVKNVKIIPTEPIKEMCEKFKEMVPSIEIRQRPAHDLGLPDQWADAVLAAHCLHWFSNAESINEIHRVLKTKGILGMIWNFQDRSVSWIKTIAEILDVKFSEKRIPRSGDKDWHVKIQEHCGFGPLHEEDNYRYSMEFDLEGLIERFKSVSVVSEAEGGEKEAILSKIENVMKTNPDVKDQEKYSYKSLVHIEWVQKLELISEASSH